MPDTIFAQPGEIIGRLRTIIIVEHAEPDWIKTWYINLADPDAVDQTPYIMGIRTSADGPLPVGVDVLPVVGTSSVILKHQGEL